MAIAYVNRAENTVSSGGGTTFGTAAASHTTGNLLVVFVQGQIADHTVSLADTAGNTWLQVGNSGGIAINSSGNVGRLFYAYNITGHATNVVTATISGSANNYVAISVRQFSGFGAVDPLESYAYSMSLASATTLTGGKVQLHSPEGVIVCGLNGGNGGTFTAGSGYTLTKFTGANGAFFADQYKIVTAAEAPTATVGGTGSWYVLAAMFTAAPAPATGGGSYAFSG